jgi:mono/diheme cytochrome c family protein
MTESMNGPMDGQMSGAEGRGAALIGRQNRAALSRRWLAVSGLVFCMMCATCMVRMAAADGSWLHHVPESYRSKQNPYAGQAEATAAGSRMFADHCAKCHGADAMGHGGRPSLRSERVQNATDGEISWLLKNGNLGKGMPSWSSLPEPTRWQLIAYIKSLGPSTAPDATAKSAKEDEERRKQ